MSFCETEEQRNRQGDAAKAQSSAACDDTNQPCPMKCKPIAAIRILSLEFRSDDGLLTDYDKDWNNGGTPFPKPQWTPARSSPVSHSMGVPVEVVLTFEVSPPDACPETGDILGIGPGMIRFEKVAVVFAGGTRSVTLKSAEKLDQKIQEMDFAVGWTANKISVGFSPGVTSTKMFVTMDKPLTPRSPGVTLKRMRHAVTTTGAAASLDPHKIVKTVISAWSEFNLAVQFDNEWELADGKRYPSGPKAGQLIGADCQTIVRHTESVIKMVGCPGKTEAIVVWAKVPTPAKGEENTWPSPNVVDPKQPHNSFRKADPKRIAWVAGLVDSKGGLNKYEACLRFTHPEGSVAAGAMKYYPGGVSTVRFSANEVINVFSFMSWCDLSVDPYVAREVIHKY